MKKDLTLVILAAGMGSRFGGLKQVEKIGPNGEFIIDYSIYDAIKVGFNKVVFVIKEENYNIFKETIGQRVESHIKTCYAFQSLDDLPKGFKKPDERVKPWGTSHAIFSARNYIDGNFAIINADDFYGYESFKILADFLNNEDQAKEDVEKFCMVGYKIKNTMSENGSVKRGVCITCDGYLTGIIESSVEKQGDEIVAYPVDKTKEFIMNENDLVSMNMLGFTPYIMKHIGENFSKFLEENKDNILNCEYLIPETLFDTIKKKKATVKVLSTNAKWYGVTYKQDKDSVVCAINKMIEEGKYPKKLW